MACVWVLYLPLGMQYLMFLGGGLIALGRLGRAASLGQAARHPLFACTLLFLAWMAISAAWSVASPGAIVSHLWHYGLPLCMLVLAATMRPNDARASLRHFVLISVAAVFVSMWWGADRLGGNQRIAFSVLLALAAAIAVVEGLRIPAGWRQRVAWNLAACLCTLGLVLQDRRTGMLVLPLLLLALVWVRLPSGWRRAAMLAVLLLSMAAIWYGSPSVQSRWEEGLQELQHYPSEGEVNTSMGMRLRLAEVSLRMLQDSPWFGHGVGSWLALWRQQLPSGELLALHTTPHNDYLLVAVQGGAVGLALFLLALGAYALAIRQRGRHADAAMLVWLTFVLSACVNVALRDAKLGLPLLILGAVSWAASRARPD